MTFLSHKLRFPLGQVYEQHIWPAEDFLNIGLDDLENDYNISNN